MKKSILELYYVIVLIFLFSSRCTNWVEDENQKNKELRNAILEFAVFDFIQCGQASLPPRVDTFSGLTRIFVLPSYGASCILRYNDPHLMYLPSGAAKNILAVFLPGSGGTPIGVSKILEEGALRGYHSIGLMYPNADPINVICNTVPNNSASCFGNAREEILTGVDKTSAVSVDFTNSIDGRLLKLLQYLVVKRPNDGWDQFLIGGAVNWNKVFLGGHSQGSGHAAFQGKIKSLGRVSIYSGVSDYHMASASNASWMNASGLTSANSYFGLVHVGDSVANFSGNLNQVTDAWLNSFGMLGTLTDADAGTPPFGNTHRLTTNLCASGDENTKHNCTMLQNQKTAWDYISYP
ncbi:BPSS1187 family protein [Leptospira stimsonii]|uniref:Alpha/beta hydrolase n=1 Tax=Leptospira stimsonii TaxID=2202203 RepID=A0ABY2N3U8_9LEPT|nr:hypothetical protein [Leptospira stimsonii]TGK23024.1 hypothetical protein EHO98_07090 [Leptospira stimsonii]TGM16543.1 hypothetical protein EHQ90_09175 [Leptospira stimsonii]